MNEKNFVQTVSSILGVEETLVNVSIPKTPEHGDYSIPCFPFARILKKSPQSIAEELCKKFTDSSVVEKTEALNGYFNIFTKKSLAFSALEKAITEEDYGSGHTGNGKTLLIEHTSINPNASPHIGRGRNAMIGNAISNLMRFEGYVTDVHYFVNDIGKQIAMLVLETEGMSDVKFEDFLSIYVSAQEKAEHDSTYVHDAYKLLHELENGNSEVLSKFEKIVDVCMAGQVKIFNELGITYDSFDKESKLVLSGKVNQVLNNLKKTGKLFMDEENRWVLNLTDTVPEAPYMPLTRADGSSLYPLRDITYTIEKLNMGTDKNIVVLGQDQKVYFKQISVALNLLGYTVPPELVCYQFVKLTDGKMSTRAGKVVLLEDLKKETVNLVSENLKERGNFDPEKAKKIAYATIVYAILKCSPNKEVTFSWDEVLSFDGNSALYIMYNYARIQSILKHSNLNPLAEVDLKLLDSEYEKELLSQIATYPSVIKNAVSKLDVFCIARYTYGITRIFSKYYKTTKVIEPNNPNGTQAKLYLVKAIGNIIKSGMQILGIEIVDQI